MNLNRQFIKDWGGKDVDRIASHYTDDGNLIVPNSAVMTGQEPFARP